MTQPATPEHDAGRVIGATGLLAAFNAAGLLAAADVHVATVIGRLVGEEHEQVLLGLAFAVRAPRLGHVCIDLAALRETVTVEGEDADDLAALPWPDPGEWLERMRGSAAVAAGDDAGADRPLRLVEQRLYLVRYWREERAVAADLSRRGGAPLDGATVPPAEHLARLFAGDEPELQRRAGTVACQRRLTVLAGGPGTGKTTSVAGILALLDGQAAASGQPLPRVALAAPTGKAAARLEEAVHRQARALHEAGAVDRAGRDRLLGLEGATLHRLLGWQPGSKVRYRHSRGNRLAHDVVVVDETSMVSLSMMARLLEAVRDDARLLLVGDPDQLASVEAGAVLGDLVGPAADPARTSSVLAGCIVVLRRAHRFEEAPDIAALAEAIESGDADRVIAHLGAGGEQVRWLEIDLTGERTPRALTAVRDDVIDAGRRLHRRAAAGDGLGALQALDALRVLCAHRRGPLGVGRWSAQVERWLSSAIEGYATRSAWYVGRPLLVTENDYGLGLFNGDTGVVIDEGGRRRAVFERRGELRRYTPAVLSAVDTVHAMTIHKSQGSQFNGVVVMLPPPDSPLLTRELLYTAATRARTRLTVVGQEAAIRAAVARPIARASGLRDALHVPPRAGAAGL